MPWHPFEKDKSYPLDYVVAKMRKRINDGGFTNTASARKRLAEIEGCGHAELVWKPEDSSFRRSPLDRSWQTVHGEQILPDHVVPYVSKFRRQVRPTTRV